MRTLGMHGLPPWYHQYNSSYGYYNNRHYLVPHFSVGVFARNRRLTVDPFVSNLDRYELQATPTRLEDFWPKRPS